MLFGGGRRGIRHVNKARLFLGEEGVRSSQGPASPNSQKQTETMLQEAAAPKWGTWAIRGQSDGFLSYHTASLHLLPVSPLIKDCVV